MKVDMGMREVKRQTEKRLEARAKTKRKQRDVSRKAVLETTLRQIEDEGTKAKT